MLGITPESKSEWLIWARNCAGRIDPFENGLLKLAMSRHGHDAELDINIKPYQVSFPCPGDNEPDPYD